MAPVSKPVVLFIEDDRRDFNAIRSCLERFGYRCERLGASEIDAANVRRKARELRPSLAVIDLMIFTGDVPEIDQEIAGYVKWFENSVIRGGRQPRPQFRNLTECRNGADTVFPLMDECPGIKILTCSVLYKGRDSLNSIAKRRDATGRLLNANEIADKIRTMWETR